MDYTRLQAIAARLIASAGGQVTLQRQLGDLRGLELQRAGAQVARPQCVFTLRKSDNMPGSMSTTEYFRTAIITGDIKVPPIVGDHLVAEGDDFTVMLVEQVRPAPGGLVLAYRLELQ